MPPLYEGDDGRGLSISPTSLDETKDESANYLNEADDRTPPAKITCFPPEDCNLASRQAQNEFATILVGTDRVGFQLPKELLMYKVPYFNSSLKDYWNGLSNAVVPRDVHTSVFEVFVDYLRDDKLPEYFVDAYKEVEDIRDFIPLYAFADKMMFYRTKNDLVNLELEIMQEGTCIWGMDALVTICEADFHGSPFYRLALDCIVTNHMTEGADWKTIEREFDGMLLFPHMTKDGFQAVIAWANDEPEDSRDESFNACLVHDHTDGSTCS